MNREIKFRFWGKFGELNEENDECEMEMLYGDRFCFFENEPINDLFASRNFQVMQYTGLKDKNGKEIYEGDVLKRVQYYEDGSTPDLHFGIITWDDCYFYSHSIKNEISRSIGNKPDCVSYEVIGNIYENPELLK